jgi:hypothetical protein
MCLTTSAASAASWLVHDVAEFTTAASALQPGDEIVLADGTWTDARLLLKGQGTAAAPIVLRAQTAGKVVLSGRSDLRLAGNYLQVSNLVFRNGYAPGDAVVAFRESSKAVASNSRVTGLVIDDYTTRMPATRTTGYRCMAATTGWITASCAARPTPGRPWWWCAMPPRAWTTSTASTTTGSARARAGRQRR